MAQRPSLQGPIAAFLYTLLVKGATSPPRFKRKGHSLHVLMGVMLRMYDRVFVLSLHFLFLYFLTIFIGV